ncbi:MAG TPA: hypothetical protein QGH10_09620 [Armatimonadota bacterium]|nr:hypothetical protein [Armatimonadota bacterium]
MPTRAVALLVLLAGMAAAQDPTWYPAAEPSPFWPDDALWIGQPDAPDQPWAKDIYLRGTWSIQKPVRRAVVMTAPMQSVRVYLDGKLTLTGHDVHEALPEWADTTDRLSPGPIFVAARVYCEWRPVLYLQMRVEYDDGTVEDFVSGDGFECSTAPGDDWAVNPAADGDWLPADVGGGYYRQPGEGIWGREFALMPMAMLRDHFADHNARLRENWKAEPPLRIDAAPERPEWAGQFSDFCHIDEATGQLVDGAGQTRHLFVTIYNQRVDGQNVMSVSGLDFDQLERDLDLMTDADVHFYMRQTGWLWLLDGAGEWAPLESQPRGTDLPHFGRGIDLLEYFVRRAHAHGRYIVFEGDFYWGAHAEVVPAPYRSRYHIYPEVLEAQALATRKIMHRFSECPNVLGMMIGEEDINLAQDLKNPHQHALFANFLERKYGSLEAFLDQTPSGYDYADLAAFYEANHKPEFWPEEPDETVLRPAYSLIDEPLAGVAEWLDIPLPVWPRFRLPGDPRVELAGHKSYNEFTPGDPLWIDFYEMREDELLFDALTRWAGIMREGMPNQLLFYSNAQDFTNSWHFLHLFRRAELPFDVIGVGCHDSGVSLADLPPWATVRKAIKVISSYRPYALAQGSPAMGIASGEGEGGAHEDGEGIRDYYAGALFDEIGGGAVWTQTYTWLHMSAPTEDQQPHQTPVLEWFGEFMPAVQGVRFPLSRSVQVLIVRNTNLQHSNMSGQDYGNVLAIAEALTQLNVEFDIAMDRDLSNSAADYKVDVSPYRLIILPSVTIDHPDAVWETLDAWLAGADGRVLAVGRAGAHGPHLQPTEGFPAMLRDWLGADDYERHESLRDAQTLLVDGAELQVDFGNAPPTGVLAGGDSLILAGDAVIGARYPVGDNTVVACGFPLGLAWNDLWGMSPTQEPRDAHVPVFEAMLTIANVDRPVIAPRNLRVYTSEAGEMLLIRERGGVGGTFEVLLSLPAGVTYPGVDITREADGMARLTVALEPWESQYWRAG